MKRWMMCAVVMCVMGCMGCAHRHSHFDQAPPQKVVFITGTASGFGRAVAERFLERGHIVYGADIQILPNQYLDELDGGHAVIMDVRDDDDVAAAIARVVREQGRIDVVINNAGYGSYGPIESVPVDEVKNQYDVNVFGYVRVVQHALPHMRTQGYGRVLMVTSVVGEMSAPLMGYYASTKHAVEAISDALRMEVRDLGIDVIKIQPGPVNTGFDEVALAHLREVRERSPEDYDALMADFEAYLLALYRSVEGPDGTADQIVRASLTRRPPTEVRTTIEAKLAIKANRWMRERRFDAFMLNQYKRAGKRTTTTAQP